MPEYRKLSKADFVYILKNIDGEAIHKLCAILMIDGTNDVSELARVLECSYDIAHTVSAELRPVVEALSKELPQ